MTRGAIKLYALVVGLAPIAVMVSLASCATQDVKLDPVWSATLPADDVTWSKTVNIFPFYSANTTAFSDRFEETYNVMLLVTWSKTTPRIVRPPVEKVLVSPGPSASAAHVAVPGLAAPGATPQALPSLESSAAEFETHPTGAPESPTAQ